MTGKTILMVCYYYAPARNSGVERSVKLAGYLPEHGWEPVVLTTGANTPGTGAGPERVIRTTELMSVYRRLRGGDPAKKPERTSPSPTASGASSRTKPRATP